MKAEKYIESVRNKANKMIEALHSEANEAYKNWADTGNERYMAKNNRLLAEADELEQFIHPQVEISRAYTQMRREREQKEALQRLLNAVQNILECDMRTDPICIATRRLEEVVREYRSIRLR